jgi:methyl-accepting chemotaxis protein
VKRLLAILVIAMALGLAACGGPSPEEKYSKAVNTDVQQAGKQIIAASQQVSSSSDDAADQAALDDMAGDLKALARQISALKPPQRVEADNAELASEISTLAAKLDNKPDDVVADAKLTIGRIKATIAAIDGDLS